MSLCFEYMSEAISALTEYRLLSDTTITDLDSLAAAIQILHRTYQVPHVIITSLRLTRDNQTLSSRAPSRTPSKPASEQPTPSDSPGRPASPEPPKPNLDDVENLTIIGSTATSDHRPRLFRIDTPQLPLFFSGTGDMFAALVLPRLIEAVNNSKTPNLRTTPSWRSPDCVPATDLPLAKACQKVLASMQSILAKTTARCEKEMAAYDARAAKEGCGSGEEDQRERELRRHLAVTNASEVRVVRFVRDLVEPPGVERFRAREMVEGRRVDGRVGERVPREGVVRLGLGDTGDGMAGWQVVTEGVWDGEEGGRETGTETERKDEEKEKEGGKEGETDKDARRGSPTREESYSSVAAKAN